MDYRTINLDEMDRVEAYKLFTTAIVPRPIGWISSMSAEGVLNAAPFSWFNAVCADPPMVMASIAQRRGAFKDTLNNIRDTGEFVVNVATEANAAKLVQSSAEYPPEVSEFEAVGLTPVPSQLVKPARIGESPIQFECKSEQIITLGNSATSLVIGRCLLMHAHEEVIAEDGMIDAVRLRPLARLGRDEYAVIGDLIEYARPTVK